MPLIHFGTGTGHLLALQREAGGDVIGVDWRTPLDEGWRLAGEDVAVQGNLDPTLLFAPRERLLARVDDVLRRAGGRPGHIFNLGHGILPGTPVDEREGRGRPRPRRHRALTLRGANPDAPGPAGPDVAHDPGSRCGNRALSRGRDNGQQTTEMGGS